MKKYKEREMVDYMKPWDAVAPKDREPYRGKKWCGKCGTPLPGGGGPCPVCDDSPYGKPYRRRK